MKKIAIFGVPRSGTSWLSQIYNSHPEVVMRFQPLFSYGHKGRISETSECDDIHAFFDEIFHSTDQFAMMLSKAHEGFPSFTKKAATHICFKETRYLNIIENILLKCDDVLIVGIVRNPLATLASWIKAPKEFMGSWDVLREWRNAELKNQNRPEEFYGFENWKRVALTFLRFKQQFSGKFFLVTYASLNRNTMTTVEELFDFSKLTMHDQVRRFVIDSKSRHDTDPYSVYRSKASDNEWSGILPAGIVKTVFQELEETELEQFLEAVP